MIVVGVALTLFALLALADRGAFNALIMHWASRQLDRPVAMRALHLVLLSSDPKITIEGLVIGNPSWLHGGRLAEAGSVVAHIELRPLLIGKLRPTELAISGLSLHLVRFGPGRNNWTMSQHPRPGPAFQPLADVTRLLIAPAKIDIRDFGRSMHVTGGFRHDAQGARPFTLAAAGTLKGYQVSMHVIGGQLNAAGVGPAWPFQAILVDDRTRVMARGVSMQPFDLSRFDLSMSAAGPNLADLGYLFNLATPNSRPFELRARARTDGRHFWFSSIAGHLGETDLAGWIRSDHGINHKRIVAAFTSRKLKRRDIEALLATIPPRALARAQSGEIGGEVASQWLFPDVPFGLERLRANDFDLSLNADSLEGYDLPLQNVATRLVGAGGRLMIQRFAARLYSGSLVAEGEFDARAALPRLHWRGRLDDVRLREILKASGQPSGARLSAQVDLKGAGLSLHRIASAARGTIMIQAAGAVVPRRAAWILGGDLLRAMGNAGGVANKKTIAIDCAAITLRSTGAGQFEVTRLGVGTPLGTARGMGRLDLSDERVSLILQGQPRERRFLQIATPLQIAGPMLSPKVTLLPGQNARVLGLKGMLGVALTPIFGLMPIKGRDARLPLAPAQTCS